MCTRCQRIILSLHALLYSMPTLKVKAMVAKVLHEITIKPRPSLIYIACMGAAPS